MHKCNNPLPLSPCSGGLELQRHCLARDRPNKTDSLFSSFSGRNLDIEIVNDYGLEQLVHFPTRERITLYLISISLPGQFVDIHSPDRLSDHDMVSGTLKMIFIPVKKPKGKVCGYQKGDCESWLFFFLEKYSNYFADFTCWLPGERSLPFGLLFF